MGGERRAVAQQLLCVSAGVLIEYEKRHPDQIVQDAFLVGNICRGDSVL